MFKVKTCIYAFDINLAKCVHSISNEYTIHQIVTQLESNQYYADVVKNKKSILVTSNDYISILKVCIIKLSLRIKFFSSKKQFVHACSVVTMISRNISMNKSQNTKTENGISSVYISHYIACHHVGCSHLGIIELPSSWLLKLPKSVEKH